LVILWFAFLGSLRAGVEQVQRDFQARYHLVAGNYLQWPECSAGKTAAPQFPKDGFYGDLTEDLDEGVMIVQDLVQKFYSDSVIYTYFVNAPNGQSDLEGAGSIDNYTADDMVVIQAAEVDTDNYMNLLAVLASQMAKLTLIQVPATQVIAANDADSKFSYVVDGDDVEGREWVTCQTTKACALNSHPLTSWGYWGWYDETDCQTLYVDDRVASASVREA